ncbi:hypothetical protein [uncultured Weissella sp.]|uniref:hypothetical protein n=1 Tax=uncultured Weissella sp. TaxID=253243 RepID=UPI00258B2474|nr:hypothetical protein [uncultured Weissella sp.]
MTETTHWIERLNSFLESETEDERILYVGKFNELVDNGFNSKQAYINLHREIVEPLLEDNDLVWEDYTEATAKAMFRPTLFDVKTWIELATKIGPSAATGNWQAVEHDWSWDLPDVEEFV